MADRSITLDDVAQFDSRVQLAVLAATSRVYAAGLAASTSGSMEMRGIEARTAMEKYLELVSPLILGSRNPD